MLPVTLGLGLININALIDGVIAAHLIDANIAPRRSTQPSASTCCRRGCSRSRSRQCSSRRSRASPRAGDTAGFRDTVSLGVRQIAFLLVPASVVTAVLAEPITRLIYQRGAFEPAQTPVVAGALAAFCARPRLQRDDADAQPRVLQPAVELGPDRRRAREPGSERRPRRRLLPLGTWGIPLATSLVNIAGTAALFVLLRRKVGRVDFGAVVALVRQSARCGSVRRRRRRALVWRRSTRQPGARLPVSSRRSCPRSGRPRGLPRRLSSRSRVREMQTLLSLRGRLRRA